MTRFSCARSQMDGANSPRTRPRIAILHGTTRKAWLVQGMETVQLKAGADCAVSLRKHVANRAIERCPIALNITW